MNKIKYDHSVLPQKVNSNSQSRDKDYKKDSQMFMSLLLTQLKNQTIDNVTDSSKIMEASIMLNNLEQTSRQTSYLKEMADAMKNSSVDGASDIDGAISYIGREVMTDFSSVTILDGRGAIGYKLPQDARNVNINLLDDAGNIVDVIPGDTYKGNNVVHLNVAMNDVIKDGKYKIIFEAKAKDGTDIAVNSLSGTVDGVTKDSMGGIFLSIEGSKILKEDVVSVYRGSQYRAKQEEYVNKLDV